PHPSTPFPYTTLFRSTPYIDRSRWSLNRLKSMLPKTAQPGIFKTLKGTMKVSLPKRAFPDSEFIRVLMARKTHRRFSKEDVTLEDRKSTRLNSSHGSI